MVADCLRRWALRDFAGLYDVNFLKGDLVICGDLEQKSPRKCLESFKNTIITHSNIIYLYKVILYMLILVNVEFFLKKKMSKVHKIGE